MRMLNVTWIAAGPAPSEALSGLANSVHTYCGLEMAIMQMSPSRSWTHRVPTLRTARFGVVTVVLMRGSVVGTLMQSNPMQAKCHLGRRRGSYSRRKSRYSSDGAQPDDGE
ncbi:MAG: hypothetical protein NVSMB18_27070 [Acetobacteraceae bacterium]